MKWNEFNYKGEVFELSHLDPFSCFFEFKHGSKGALRKYRLNVTFSMHCFTKQLLPNETDVNPLLFYKSPKETRVFCFERYKLSRQLPEIIKNIDKKICWHTHHGHFFTIELQDKNRVKSEYEIYFDVYKSGKGWLTLIVKSAYIRDEVYQTAQPKKRRVRFSVIAKSRFENRKLRPPR